MAEGCAVVTTGRGLLLALTLTAVVVGAAACSGDADGPQADPAVADGDPVDGGPADDGAAAAGGPGSVLAFDAPDADDVNLLLASEDGLADLEPVEILDVSEDEPQRLTLAFEMASHRCHGVHLDVVETDTTVSLALRSGRRPGVAPTLCAYGVYPYTTAADLAAPLGERQLVLAGSTSVDETNGGTSDGTIDGAGGSAAGGSAAAGTADPEPPIWFDPSRTEADEVGRYLGRHVEEAVEWAQFHDRAWRILSYDGVPRADASPDDPERISFVVVADVIVDYEWS